MTPERSREPCCDSRVSLLSQGNRLFKDGRYDGAVECYTRAMDADPYDPVLPTNRAACFFRLRKYVSVPHSVVCVDGSVLTGGFCAAGTPWPSRTAAWRSLWTGNT